MKNNQLLCFRSSVIPGILGLGALVFTAVCPAATIGNYTPVAGSWSRPGDDGGGPYTIGYSFTVTQAGGITITHLGVLDAAPGGVAATDGFLAPTVAVGLWSAAGTNLATDAVSSTATIIDSFRYVELATPVTLTEGASYIIGAFLGTGQEYFLDSRIPNSPVFTANAGITLTQNRHSVAGSLAAPMDNSTQIIGRWGAVNAMVVPEPSTALLGGLGLLALLRRRRS